MSNLFSSLRGRCCGYDVVLVPAHILRGLLDLHDAVQDMRGDLIDAFGLCHAECMCVDCEKSRNLFDALDRLGGGV